VTDDQLYAVTFRLKGEWFKRRTITLYAPSRRVAWAKVEARADVARVFRVADAS
jgi:hypothetical protein